MNMKLNLRILLPFVVMLELASCTPDKYFDLTGDPSGTESVSKTPDRSSTFRRKVMIFVSGGKNSLHAYLKADIEDLKKGYIPTDFAGDHVLVTLVRNGSSATTYAPTCLIRLFKDRTGNVVQDTLKRWEKDPTQIFGGSTLLEALTLVRDLFPASGYGMVLSSHGSGYLPDGYYSDPQLYDARHPLSIGQDEDYTGNVEMELAKFRSSIPYHLDYILLDACLMGGVETAYELRDVTDVIGFSQTEILAEGFDYSKITTRLLQDEPDPVQVCIDYFNQYKDQSDPTYRSATISAINTAAMDDLASVCKVLFERYRAQIAVVDPNKVQKYFRNFIDTPRPFFYDLRDILAKSGASDDDLSHLDAAIAKAVIYEAHTEQFMRSFELENCCGFSMFLPKMGSDVLKDFYKKNIAWNQATELVK